MIPHFTLDRYYQCYIDPKTNRILWYSVNVNYIRFLYVKHDESK